MDQRANHILSQGSQPGAADRMRELLARTVQDHMLDQQSNAAAIEEVRKHLEGLEWLVKDAGERESANIAAQIDSLFRRLDDASQTPPRWAVSLAGQIEALQARAEALAGQIGALQAQAETLQEQAETLQEQEKRLAALHQNGTRLQQSMEAAAARFSRLDKAIAELSQQAGYLGKEMTAVKGRADQGFTALGAKIEQGTAAVPAALEQNSARLEQSLAGMAEKAGGIAAGVAALREQADLLGSQLQVAQGRFDGLGERLGDTDDRIAAIDNRLGAAADRIGAVDSRLSGLEKHLTDALASLTGELRSRPAHAEIEAAVSKIVDDSQAGVAIRLSSLEETVLTLAEALLRPASRRATAAPAGDREEGGKA
jgi:chromosome segregation ATPase